MPHRVYLELGAHRVFACALEWPGWCRSGRDEARALEALSAAAERYARVAAQAGVAFRVEPLDGFEVVERLAGSSTTDFGVPGAAAAADHQPLSRHEAERIAAVLEAAWTIFDRVVAAAPAALRKGPRGGGRDRDAIVEHVLGAETMYARKLDVRQPQPRPEDRASILALRQAILGALRAAAEGGPPVDRGWPPRYAARRIAWHVLDHAWEIEDRAL